MKKTITVATSIGAFILGATGCGATGAASAPNATSSANGAQPAAKVISTSISHAQPDPNLKSWNGKEEIALIYNDKAAQGMNGGKLYTVTSGTSGDTNSKSSSKAPEEHFIADHVESAQFSTDGQWLAVVTLEAPTGNSKAQADAHEQLVQTLWLMSADGQQKQKLAAGDVTPGVWVAGSDTYVYGRNPVYSVKPGQKAVRLSVQLPNHATIGQYEASGDENAIAIVTTEPTPRQDVIQRFDSIDVLNPATGAVRVLKTGRPSDGFVLGPWINESTLFYWPDAMHSASLLADGAELSTLPLDGKTQKITTTLTGQESVATSASGKSAIQAGAGRTLFTSKAIGMWDGHTLELLPHADHAVAFWPTVDETGTQIAYEQGPELSPTATEAQTQAWWQKLQLGTYNVQTHKTNVLAAAGDGVIAPYYDKAGDAIIYLKDNSLYWIRSDGNGSAYKVVTFLGEAWRSYPQQGSSMSLEIADYQP